MVTWNIKCRKRKLTVNEISLYICFSCVISIYFKHAGTKKTKSFVRTEWIWLRNSTDRNIGSHHIEKTSNKLFYQCFRRHTLHSAFLHDHWQKCMQLVSFLPAWQRKNNSDIERVHALWTTAVPQSHRAVVRNCAIPHRSESLFHLGVF